MENRVYYKLLAVITILSLTGCALLGLRHRVADVEKNAQSELAQKEAKIKELTVRLDTTYEFLGLTQSDVMGYSVNTCYTTSLKKSIASTATTSIEVESSKLCNGEEMTPSYPLYLMINSGAPNSEIIECWGMTTSTSQNLLNDCNRGLSFSGNSSTSTISGNAKAHAGSEKVSQTNVHYTYDQLFDKWANETMFGTTSTFQGIYLNRSSIGFKSTSTDGYVKDFGGYLGWVEPISGSSYLFRTGGSGVSASTTLGIIMDASTLGISFAGATNNYVDIGSFGHAINDLMASGTIYSTNFGNSLLPSINNSKDLGAFGTAWGKGYVSSTLYVGGDGTVTSTILSGDLDVGGKLYVGGNRVTKSQTRFFFPFIYSTSTVAYNNIGVSSTIPFVVWKDGTTATSTFMFKIPEFATTVNNVNLLLETSSAGGVLLFLTNSAVYASSVLQPFKVHVLKDYEVDGIDWKIDIPNNPYNLQRVDISNGKASTTLQGGDIVYGTIQRDSTGVNDTINADVNVFGIELIINE